jgi:protein-tyrosine phosphatase
MLQRRNLSLILASAISACAPTTSPTPESGWKDGRIDADSGAATCKPGRWILVDAVPNARDLGGTPLADGATVACDALFRGAALGSVSAPGCAELGRLGLRTIVDLRTPGERLAAPAAACVQAQARIVLAPMPIPYSADPTEYLAILDRTESVAAAFSAIGDAAAYPIYLQCTYGRDRTGVLIATVLRALGAARETVLGEYQLSAAAGLTTYPASLETVLDELDRRGGVEAYLAAAGVSSEILATLRARAITP